MQLDAQYVLHARTSETYTLTHTHTHSPTSLRTTHNSIYSGKVSLLPDHSINATPNAKLATLGANTALFYLMHNSLWSLLLPGKKSAISRFNPVHAYLLFNYLWSLFDDGYLYGSCVSYTIYASYLEHISFTVTIYFCLFQLSVCPV